MSNNTASLTRPIVTVYQSINHQVYVELTISETAVIRYQKPDDDEPAIDRHIISSRGMLTAEIPKGNAAFGNLIEVIQYQSETAWNACLQVGKNTD